MNGNNKAKWLAGGISNGGTLYIRDSVIYNNVASGSFGFGAAIYSFGSGNLSIINTTITKNVIAFPFGTESQNGAAILIHGGSVVIKNSTISHNQGIGIKNYGSQNVSIQNSIVAENTYNAADDTINDCYAMPVYAIKSQGYNLIGNLTCNIISSEGDIFNVNPYLGTYSPERNHVPLLQNSPAIDAGSPSVPGSGGSACEATDQLGTSRPIDGDQNAISICDIGAYEATPPDASVLSVISIAAGSNQTAIINTPYLPLSVLVTDQYGTPIKDVNVKFVAPGSGPSGMFNTTESNQVSVMTNARGLAISPEFVANGIAGQYVIVASVVGLNSVAEFSVENYEPVPTTIDVYGGNNQYAKPGDLFTDFLAVVIKDNFDRPFPGVSVTFSAPNPGPSGTFSITNSLTTTAITNDQGIATSDLLRANSISGSFQVSASVSGPAPVAQFTLNNAKTWYVSTTGNDSADCSFLTTPCKSIQHAINISNKLDSIKVMQGTYKISDNQICEGTLCRAISLTDKNVEILGGWDSAFTQQVGFSIIDSEMSGYGVMVSPSSTLILEKIIVTNGYTVYGSTSGIWNLGTLTVRESVIHNNTISGFASGGAAILSLGTLFITNSTIANNKNADVPQSTYASAVSVLAGTAIIKNSTISHNKAIGIMNGGSGNVSIQNSIVAGNYVSVSNATPYDCSGILISNGYNLIQNKTCNITANTGDIFNINPYLGAYSVEQSLVPLLQNSPAIDAGNPAVPGSGGYACEETDQFGTSRPIDGNQDALSVCDMGAYETTPPIASVVSNISVVAGSNQTAVINTPYLPFSALIIDQYGAPLEGVSVEFVGPASGPGGKFSTTGTNKVNVTTNSSGLATSPEFVANDIGGQYVVEASVSGLSSVVKFSLENYRPVPTSISVYSGDNQNVSPGRIFKHNLKVIVRDNFGRPLGGALVKFSAPDYGPSGIFSDTNNNTTTAITDDAGIAIAAPMSANLIIGTFNVLASVADLPQTAQFNLNNIQLYVHPSGSDTSTCTTPNAPCKTISGALSKGISEITIFVADGVYRNSGNSGFVLNISDNIFLSGGWDDSFTIQNGFSTIDGENSKAGVVVNSSAIVYIERFIVQHSGNDEKPVGGVGNSGVLTLNQCTISNNNTYYRGGGIQNYGTLTLINSTVSHNHSNMHGGGIYNSLQATLSVTDSEIANNTSKYQDSFSGGVETYGGGLYNKGKVFIDRGRFYNNSAFYGGGIYNDASGDLAIQNSSIFNNQVDAGGGGLANASEKANLESVTFSNNLATSGGGIFTYKTIKLNNVTIANNFARYKGGGIFSDQYENGVFNLTNTIIADNIADDYVSDCYGQAASGGYNIIGSTAGCSVVSKTGDKFDVTPKLGKFLPGEGYSVLLKNSPAIDAGDHSNCKATDQRGAIRVDGNSDSIVTCDIGAIEYVFPTGVPEKLTIVSGNDQHASPDAEFQIPLKAVVLDTAGHPMGGVAVTFSSPATGPSGFFTNNLNTITRISDASGVADAGIFMANHQRGSYFVTASAVGISENISFNNTFANYWLETG